MSGPVPTHITDRELAVLRCVCSGSTAYKEAGAALGLSASTVRGHLNAAYRTLIRAGAIPDTFYKKTTACVWLWRVEQAARGEQLT